MSLVENGGDDDGPSGAYYSVFRALYQSAATSGGVKGLGGRGQGYAVARVLGTAGTAGGLNAGAGGRGGDGGTWGVAGTAGLAGGSGNVGAGGSPVAGGLAGFAIRNIGNVSLSNAGTFLGRT